jgi:hypothetical protein
MDAGLIDRIETNAERAASALLAGAVGYAVYASLDTAFSLAELGACAAVAGVLTYLLCSRALLFVAKRQPRHSIAIFDLRKIEAEELLLTDRLLSGELLLTDRLKEELVLTDADRLEPSGLRQEESLVLDDILAEMGPDARVVRLFDPKAMPTPNQLRSRIDSHLAKAQPPAGASDASQALADALAELRRSLR